MSVNTLKTNTVITLVSTSVNADGGIQLPAISNAPNRVLYFKDFAGGFSSNNLTLIANGTDIFENTTQELVLSNNYDCIGIYADPTNNMWVTLSGPCSNWSQFSANSTVDYNNNPSLSNVINVYNDIASLSNQPYFQNALFSFYGYFSYFNSNLYNPRPIASDWANFRAANNVDLSSNVIENVNQLNVNYIYGNGMGSSVTFGTNINMYTNEISNVAQTSNINSAATNLIGRRVYFDSPVDTGIDNTTYSNVLTKTPTTPITYNNPTAFYTYLNCTISFCCDGAKDDLAYHLRLSNTTATTDLSGEIFNRNYPYIENENKINTYNHSISFQEQFNITTWANGDVYIPMLFVISGTGAHTLSNMKFSMVYEPLLP